MAYFQSPVYALAISNITSSSFDVACSFVSYSPCETAGTWTIKVYQGGTLIVTLGQSGGTVNGLDPATTYNVELWWNRDIWSHSIFPPPNGDCVENWGPTEALIDTESVTTESAPPPEPPAAPSGLTATRQKRV